MLLSLSYSPAVCGVTNGGPSHLFYRHDILARAGVSPNALSTWGGVLTVAQNLTGKDWDGDGVPEYGFCFNRLLGERSIGRRTRMHATLRFVALQHMHKARPETHGGVNKDARTQGGMGDALCAFFADGAVAALIQMTGPLVQTKGPNEGYFIDAATGKLLLTTAGARLAYMIYQRYDATCQRCCRGHSKAVPLSILTPTGVIFLSFFSGLQGLHSLCA